MITRYLTAVAQMQNRIYLVALVGLALMLVGSQACAVCYVDQNAKGKNDGSTWTNAYVHPQLALINGCTEIWVAKGVYTPVLTGSDPTASFDIPAGTKMYGGFISGAATLDDRHPFTDFTVLSGDLENNDDHSTDWLHRTTENIRGTNSAHILTMYGTTVAPVTPETVIDGFVLTAADNSTNDAEGSALDCSTLDGSAICAPTLKNLIVSGNKGRIVGAAAKFGSGNMDISNSLFFGNTAASAGGALSDVGTGNLHISDSAFANNKGAEGGALITYERSAIENVTFTANGAHYGGAIFLAASSNHTLVNVTFAGNTAVINGSAVEVARDVPAAFTNAIFWANTAGSGQDISADIDGTTQIENSVVEGGCPSYGRCTFVSPEDPKLSSAGFHGGLTITLLPGIGGSAIDTGDDVTCPAFDQRGFSRSDGHCDIGAVEWQPADEIIFRNGFQ